MQKIKKLACFVLNYGVLAWMAAIVVWYLIVCTLKNGISCDEGYYLMGYLRGQNVEGQATDFHSIVRAVCSPFADDDIMVFRYLRLVMNGLALLVFALSSFRWLSRKKKLTVSRWAYYPFVALAGAMSFTFAAPTVSYDSIELILALLIATLLFVQLATGRKWIRHLSGFGIGFLLWFAFANYPPAGVCLAVLFAVVYFLECNGEKWKDVVFAIVGLGAAMVVHHLFVHDLRMWFSDIAKVFVSTFTEKSKSRHDSGSLVSAMLLTVGKQLLIYVPTTVVLTLLMKKVTLPKWLQWAMVLLICAVLLVVRGVYHLYGTLLLFPIALVLSEVLSKPCGKISRTLFNKEMLMVLVFVVIPLAGVFGTNQAVMRKAVVFAPFWLVAYYLLSTQVKKQIEYKLDLVLLTMLFAGYIYLGNFERYHYYYTPRSSKYELTGVLRPQKVLVSQYQQSYFHDVLDSLQMAGCKAGDRYMAFGENQMAVYLAGGFIDGRLPYHWWQYKMFEKEPPKAFILFKNEEADVVEYFKQAEWDFPEGFRRMELRQMSENMGDDYRTVVFVRED
jgi:hypothetical protein